MNRFCGSIQNDWRDERNVYSWIERSCSTFLYGTVWQGKDELIPYSQGKDELIKCKRVQYLECNVSCFG